MMCFVLRFAAVRGTSSYGNTTKEMVLNMDIVLINCYLCTISIVRRIRPTEGFLDRNPGGRSVPCLNAN